MDKSDIISEIEGRVSRSKNSDYTSTTIGITDKPKTQKTNMLMMARKLGIGKIGLQTAKKTDWKSKNIF